MSNDGEPEIRCEIVSVTPTLAQEWLRCDHRPRRQGDRYIRAYAREMSEGRWQLNGETIIFSSSGHLLDGRKRLRACVQSGVPFQTIVVKQVREEDFQTIDALRARTAVDTLFIRNEPFGRALSAASNILWKYYRYYQFSEPRKPGVTSRDTLAVLDQRPELRESVVKTSPLSRVGWHSTVAVAHHLASRVSREVADSFFGRVASDSIEDDDPAGLLRRQLERSTSSDSQRMLALAILAWNAEYLGTPIKTLRWRQEGSHPQRFPTVADLPVTDGVDLDQHRKPNFDVVVEPDELQVGIEEITPTVAGQLLTTNDKNRKRILRVVDKYARDMAAGNWALNGQSIKIGKSGKLLDGQHRCLAAVTVPHSFMSIVVRGLPDEIFETLDSGPVRSLGEVLATRGEKNANALGAALQKLWLYYQNAPTFHSLRGSHAELLQVLEEHPGIRRSVNFTLSKLHDLVPPAIAATTHYLATQVDVEKANEFVERVSDGVRLDLNSPILKFRDVMSRDRRNNRDPLREIEKWALMIKAMNAFFSGAEIKLLVWRQGAREVFPRLVERAVA